VTERRPWPAYVAVVALVGLLVAAYVAGRPGPARMWITPEEAEPGGRVVVRYEEPRVIVQLTVQHAGKAYYVTDGEWTELEGGSYFATITSLDEGTLTSEVTVPDDATPGHYLLCSDGQEPMAADLTIEEFADAADDLKSETLCADLVVTSP
jgi:hypothetical protein